MVSPGPRVADDRALPARTIWRVAIAGGLLFGWAEVGCTWLRGATRSAGSGLGIQSLWMTPLSTLLWFLLLGAAFTLTRPVARWRLGPVVAAVTALGVLDLLLAWGGVHWAALLLLPAGVGLQAGRLGRARPARILGWLRPLPSVGLALIVLAAAGTLGLERWREHRAVASLPPARTGMPNVLLLVFDAVRADEMSLYGAPDSTTPGLDRLARDGVVFDLALAAAPWTLPSHGSMFTGRWAHEQASAWTVPLGTRFPTLAERLAGAGYRTAGFVGNVFYGRREMGLGRGFAHYEDYARNAGELLMSSATTRRVQGWPRVRRAVGYHDILGRKRAPDLTRRFLAWQARSGGRPFFAFINFYDAHEPFLPPPAFERRFAASGLPRPMRYRYRLHDVLPDDRYDRTPEDDRREREAYRASIAYLDAAVDSLARELARRGVLDRTILVVTSDHGEHFGERNLHGHTTSLFSQVLHVPLLIRWPGAVPAGVRIGRPATLRDLGATILELAGVDAPFPGRSLSRFWRDSAEADRSPILASLARSNGQVYRSVVLGSLHYIVQPDWKGLFDLATDPGEETDLRLHPALAPVLARAERVLDSVSRSREAAP